MSKKADFEKAVKELYKCIKVIRKNHAMVLSEKQKKEVCEYYACSDMENRKYPKCKRHKKFSTYECKLRDFLRVLDCLNYSEKEI